MVSAWNNAKTNTTLQVAKALRLELKKSDNDNSSVLVQAQRRIAGAVLTARSMSQLAMGHLVAAMLDAEAGVDCAPELALVHVRLGEVYEACGGREAAVRVFQRAAALSPNSQAIAARLEAARNAPAWNDAETPAWASATPSRASSGLKSVGSGSSLFDVTLDEVDKEWELTGLQHIKRFEWFDLRQKTCPHGTLLTVRDLGENNDALARHTRPADLAEDAVTPDEYTEKELFCERAMILFSKKRMSGASLPEGSTWLDLAFEAVNIDALGPAEQAKICLSMGNIFAWCADFSGADELYSFALELDELELPDASLARWRPALLANRALCRLRLGLPTDAAADAETALREAGPRWGVGLARMGQVMMALSAWDKAEQTFGVAHRRCKDSSLELKVKMALAASGGMGLPAAAEAGAKAVEAVKSKKQLQVIGDLLEELDAVVQLDALEPDADVDPIMGPTPRFMAEVTEGVTAETEALSMDDVSPAQRKGKVKPLGGDGRSLGEELSALDAKGGNQSAAASEATVGVADQAKKRERPRDASGQEVDSARMAELDLEDSEYGGDASPNEKLKKKGRARYSQCGGGCGDFFYWASGGLLGSQTKPPGPPPGPPAGDGLDAAVAEDLKNAGAAKVEAKPATSVSA